MLMKGCLSVVALVMGGCKYEREIDEYFGVPSRSSPGLEY
jgi:hypothetical protein